jgi:hypothetical protein
MWGKQLFTNKRLDRLWGEEALCLRLLLMFYSPRSSQPVKLMGDPCTSHSSKRETEPPSHPPGCQFLQQSNVSPRVKGWSQHTGSCLAVQCESLLTAHGRKKGLAWGSENLLCPMSHSGVTRGVCTAGPGTVVYSSQDFVEGTGHPDPSLTAKMQREMQGISYPEKGFRDNYR